MLLPLTKYFDGNKLQTSTIAVKIWISKRHLGIVAAFVSCSLVHAQSFTQSHVTRFIFRSTGAVRSTHSYNHLTGGALLRGSAFGRMGSGSCRVLDTSGKGA